MSPPRLALRCAGLATLLAAGLALGVQASGLLPAGVAAFVWGGLAVAAVAMLVGNLLLAQALADRSALAGRRLLTAVLADFLLHLVLGVGTSVAVFLVGAKFLAGASFALAFAASALVMRITSAGVMSRALRSPSAPARPGSP